MTTKPDDLEAVRTLVDTLKPFEVKEQERIIRWAQEKLGLLESGTSPKQDSNSKQIKNDDLPPKIEEGNKNVDIKTFVTQKNPSSDNQFAATVAYYHALMAPIGKRKEAINGDDLQEACRQVNRHRLRKPGQTLINAHHAGLLDKAGDTGAYRINTVGENLVAMALPATNAVNRSAGGRSKTSKKSKAKSKKRR